MHHKSTARAVSNSTEPDQVVVYAKRGVFAFMALFFWANAAWTGALLVYGLLDTTRNPDTSAVGLVLPLILFLPCVGLAVWLTGETLARPRPVLILDRDGIEWWQGRIPWRQVSGIEFVHSEGTEGDSQWSKDSLFLSFKITARRLPATHDFARGKWARSEGPEWTGARLEIKLADHFGSSLSIETVRRFYGSPIMGLADFDLDLPKAAPPRPCEKCGRLPRAGENPKREWRSIYVGTTGEAMTLCPECTALMLEPA